MGPEDGGVKPGALQRKATGNLPNLTRLFILCYSFMKNWSYRELAGTV